MPDKTVYEIGFEQLPDGSQILIEVDTGEPIKGRITMCGLLLVGTRYESSGKVVMVFREP